MLTNENPAGQGGVSELGHAAKQTRLEHKAQASCAQANALAPAGKSSNKKSWRDVIKVHPAADLFPMMSEAELRELGEDIKKNGLKTDIIFWSPTIDASQPTCSTAATASTPWRRSGFFGFARMTTIGAGC